MHRDLYGDKVFPLQVVINLNDPGADHTGGERHSLGLVFHDAK